MAEKNDPISMAEALLGQDRHMPSRLDASDMPPSAAAAYKAVSGAARRRAMRYLLGNPGSTRAEVAENAGISKPSAQVALNELEELGYINADLQGSRHGRYVRYHADSAAFEADLHAFVEWMLRRA